MRKLFKNPGRKALLVPYLDLREKGLEIGASINPTFPKSENYPVKILDHAPREELRLKYGSELADRIEEVDYIWTGEPYQDLVQGEKFAWILAAHVLEHVPDLIGFINDCASILKENGVLALVVPDKRFCFDYFRPQAALSAVIEANASQSKHPGIGSYVEYHAYFAEKCGKPVWEPGCTREPGFTAKLDPSILKDYEKGKYNDVHVWAFTPASCRLVLEDLNRLELIKLREQAFIPTVGHEFYLILSFTGNGPDISRTQLARKALAECAQKVFVNKAPRQLLRSIYFWLREKF